MSVTLPVVDLSTAVVGTNGTISLQGRDLVSIPSKLPPFLAIYNDSGAGLLIQLTVSQQQFYLSAKGHILVAIANGETDIKYSVQNISTNIQVNQLWAVYFYPGEPVTDFSALGTSTVSQQAVTLQNLGNPVGNNVIFIEPLGDTSTGGVFNVKNDGTMTIGDNLHGGSIQVLSTNPATNTIVTGADVAAFSAAGAGLGGFDLNATGINPDLSLTDSNGNNIIKLMAQKQTLTGNTAGTLDVFSPFQGVWKVVYVQMHGFRVTTTSQTVALPVAFTSGAHLLVANINCTFELLSGGVAQTINAYNNGAIVSATTITGGHTADIQVGFDTLRFSASGASPSTGNIVIIGV